MLLSAERLRGSHSTATRVEEDSPLYRRKHRGSRRLSPWFRTWLAVVKQV